MANLDQLLFLYNQIYSICTEISSNLSTEEYDKLQPLLKERSKLLNAVTLIQNGLPSKTDYSFLKHIAEKIALIEKENFEKMETIKAELKTKLNKNTASLNMLKRYAPIDFEPGSMLDYNE